MRTRGLRHCSSGIRTTDSADGVRFFDNATHQQSLKGREQKENKGLLGPRSQGVATSQSLEKKKKEEGCGN